MLLYDRRRTGTIGAGAVDRFGENEFETDERVEIVYAEVVPPITGPGVTEELEDINLIIDGVSYVGGNQVRLKADQDNMVHPTRNHILSQASPVLFVTDPLNAPEALARYGIPMFGEPRSLDPLKNTTIKVKSTINLEMLVGTVAVTQPRVARLWGYRYKTPEALVRAYGGPNYNGILRVEDTSTNRFVTVPKNVSNIEDNWEMLPGGQQQETPIVLPMLRWAQNNAATVANRAFELRFDNLNVLVEKNNMRFDLLKTNQVIVISHLGVRAATNLGHVQIIVNAFERPPASPGGTAGYPTRLTGPAINGLHFGTLAPEIGGVSNNMYMPLPPLDQPIVGMKEILSVAILDDGTSIPAPTTRIAAPMVVMKAVDILLGS